MLRTIEFSEPVTTYTALQLRDMPLTKMQRALDTQERHVIKEQSVGRKALAILKQLRGGAVLTCNTEKKRNAYVLNGKAVSVYTLRQLALRGYINAPELIKEAPAK